MRSYLAGLTLTLASCGAPGEGTVVVTAYGESFIEEGIPAEEFGDGWAVEFSRFEVTLRDVTIGGVDGAAPSTVDLTAPTSGQGQEIDALVVQEGDHTGSSFTIARVEVDGAATKGAQTQTFSWVFDAPTHHDECETTTTVVAGGTATFQITVHADHLFYDSLVAEEPQLLFQQLADADTDEDGVIAQAELAAADIGPYDPGSEGGIDDLWAWLMAQARTLGHVDGEGHCRATAAD